MCSFLLTREEHIKLQHFLSGSVIIIGITSPFCQQHSTAAPRIRIVIGDIRAANLSTIYRASGAPEKMGNANAGAELRIKAN